MKLLTKLTAVALLTLPFQLTEAQTTQAPAYKGVSVCPIPKPVLWTLTFTYPEESNAAGGSVVGRIRTLCITEVGHDVHVQITRTDGLIQEMWKMGGEEFGKNSKTPDWARLTVTSDTENPYFQTNVFPGTDWIKSDSYLGTIKYQDTTCLVFMKDPPAGLDINSEESLKEAMQTGQYSAIVNATNHLPIEVHSAGVKEVFAFETPPKKLTLPSDLTAQIAEGNKVRAALSMRAPRPY